MSVGDWVGIRRLTGESTSIGGAEKEQDLLDLVLSLLKGRDRDVGRRQAVCHLPVNERGCQVWGVAGWFIEFEMRSGSAVCRGGV